MILGSRCTRNCRFCSVQSGMPAAVDPAEPEQVAEAAADMRLTYVVITSVTRDDLKDGGAGQFKATIAAVRNRLPHSRIEVLTPDFLGSEDALRTVLSARPDVFNHNIETVRRLYDQVRPQADYERSLTVLRRVREIAPGISTKSGFMLGLGETAGEVSELLVDLRRAGCDLVTIGQYLQPSRNNLPVVEYILPERFRELSSEAYALGFRSAASGPLVRSSMNAEELYRHV